MKNQLIYIIIIILSLTLILSCQNHKEGDGHNHDTKENNNPTENSLDDTETNFVTLTEDQIKAVGIEFGNLENKKLTATLKANGLLRVPNNNKGNATLLYGGVIKTLNVQIGDYVNKGQIIATIANPQFVQLQEEFLTIGSKIIFAEQELQRQEELFTGNAGALKNLQNAKTELSTLRTRKASLQQQIQLMGINPNSVSNANLKSALVVTSPITGTVSNVFAKIGSYVDVASPVAEIVDNSSLHLDLQVFEKDLPLLKIGQTIYFTLTNNPSNKYEAKVFSIGSSFENESKTISIHCDILGNRTGLIDGMNVTAVISLNDQTLPSLPTEAIVNSEGNDYVFIISEKKDDHKHDRIEDLEPEKNNVQITLEKIQVIKGVSDMGFTAVSFLNDLPKDTKVVTKGAFFVNAKLNNAGGHEH